MTTEKIIFLTVFLFCTIVIPTIVLIYNDIKAIKNLKNLNNKRLKLLKQCDSLNQFKYSLIRFDLIKRGSLTHVEIQKRVSKLHEEARILYYKILTTEHELKFLIHEWR